jgi:hypothetical protein
VEEEIPRLQHDVESRAQAENQSEEHRTSESQIKSNFKERRRAKGCGNNRRIEAEADRLDNVLPSDESEGNLGAIGPMDKAKTALHHLEAIEEGDARAKALIRRGLDKERAWRSAKNQRGPWWNAGASHMNQAYPKSYFEKLGLISLEMKLKEYQS